MKNNIRILFATDFLDSSRKALNLLKQLQNTMQADIHIVHVITSFWKDWFSSGMYEKEAKQRLATWLLQVDNGDFDKDKIHILKGHCAEAILSLSNEIAADLIVLGSANPEHFGHIMTGSTAEASVRSADKSVFLCNDVTIKNVLCAVDGSEPSIKALNVAVDTCEKLSAKLCVVSVLPKLDINPLGMEEKDIQEQEQLLKKSTIEKIDAILDDFDFRDVEVERLYPWGTPSRVIINIAEDFAYDLIVIGAKGHSRLAKVLMGTTAEKVLRKTPCSLLVVR